MEVWKKVCGHEEKYEVSNTGKVKSIKKDYILTPSVSPKGYLVVRLYKDGKYYNYFVHRIVATAFVDNPNSLPIINHKDEIKSNNNAENLEWCTNKYNLNYGRSRERLSEKMCKPIIQRTIDGDFVHIYKSLQQAQAETGVKKYRISDCICNRRKSSGGYVWEKI